MKTKSPLFRIDRLLIAVLALIAVPQANAQTVRTWANTGASTAWYSATNWNPSTAPSAWATNDTALFQNAGTATTAGINMNTASLSISAIHVNSTRSRALTIGNSSPTVGTLTLNGTTVNSISNVILRNASANLLTLQNDQTGAGKTMNIALGNSTNNIISVDGTGGITISSVIQGAGLNLTISGTNTGTVTLSGANTFSGTLTTSATTTSVSGTQSVTNVVVDGGTLNLGAADRFLNTAAVSISSGTLGMSAFNDTVGSFLISGGTLAGSGTLTASTYALQGGTLTANLGAGAATVTTGTTALNGALAASTVDVASGTLTAGSAGRFTGTPTVTVSNGATLNLAGNETFGSLAGAGSVSNSAGRITAGGNNTSTTFSGVLSGAGELTKTGIGRLSLSGSSSYNGATTVSSGDLNLSGGSIASSAVTVASGASLSGYGSVGAIGGAGAINPGNSPGILTTPQVNPSGETDFNLEMTGTAPTYNNASNSVNDVIRITGLTPFSAPLAAGNGINIYFSGDALFTGSPKTITGGFFTDQSASFAGFITNAMYNYYFANAIGTNSYNGANYYSKAQYETAVLSSNLMTITITTVARASDFGSGNVNGQVMQIDVIPEPSTYALLVLAVIGLGAQCWRRGRKVA